MEHLQIVTGSDAIPKTYALTSDSIVIGRQPYCDLVLNNNAISREHAKLEKKNGVWYVEDLQSRNGVWLNGKRLSYEPTQLTDGDVLLLGDTTIFFHTRDSSPTGSPRAQEEDVDRFTIEDELDPSAIQSQFVVGVNGSSVNLASSIRLKIISVRFAIWRSACAYSSSLRVFSAKLKTCATSSRDS